MFLHIDVETSSETDLKRVGLPFYSAHQSTEILMLAHAADDGPVEQWQPHLGPMPDDLRANLLNPEVTKVAWNLPFERSLLADTLGIRLPLQSCFDTMAHSRFLGYPGGLDDACRVLDLGDDGKMDAGKKLIKMFSIETKATTKRPAHFKNWETNPAEWETFLEYNRQDVVAERAVGDRLNEIELFPASEYRVWLLDQIINGRGLPVDRTFVTNAFNITESEVREILGLIKEITGVVNPNSVHQLKKWFAEQGYKMESLDAFNAETALADRKLPAQCREVLLLKQRQGGSSTKKLAAILDRTLNGRLSHQFIYHQAHTGRWASWGVNVQNLKRPTPRVKKLTDEITGAILRGDDISQFEIPVIEAVSGVLRSSFRAPDGSRFLSSDLAQIENRVLAWLSGCTAMMEIYESGLCAYKTFAVKMFGKPYDEITAEERQRAKPPVLGAGFGMGAARLAAYAKAMGVTMTEEDAQIYIDIFRAEYPEIVNFWANLGTAAMQAVQQFCMLRLGNLTIDGSEPGMLRIELPSGRSLHYVKPMITFDAEYNRNVLVYEGTIKGWSVVKTRGSKLVENVVQAVARDLLVAGMLRAHAMGFPLVAHCHDEMTALLKYSSPLTLADFNSCLTAPESWTGGLRIEAEGFESVICRKN